MSIRHLKGWRRLILAQVLPRMGFSTLPAINYDGSRKRNTVQKRFKTSTTTGVHETQHAEVPYNIGFQLTIAARTMDDALQIVEQILPFFTPEFTLSLNYSDFNTKVDLPIVLQSVNPEIEYEGDLTTQRNIIFTLDFVAQSYVFAPTKTSKYITKHRCHCFQFSLLHGWIDHRTNGGSSKNLYICYWCFRYQYFATRCGNHTNIFLNMMLD